MMISHTPQQDQKMSTNTSKKQVKSSVATIILTDINYSYSYGGF